MEEMVRNQVTITPPIRHLPPVAAEDAAGGTPPESRLLVDGGSALAQPSHVPVGMAGDQPDAGGEPAAAPMAGGGTCQTRLQMPAANFQ